MANGLLNQRNVKGRSEGLYYATNITLEQYGFGVWLLVNRNTGELLGHCGLRKIDETGEIEIMYLLDPEYWGNGYASEAAKASIQYAKEMMNVKRIIARVKVANENSKNFYEI